MMGSFGGLVAESLDCGLIVKSYQYCVCKLASEFS